MGERHFIEDVAASGDGIEYFSNNPSGVGDTLDEKWMWSRHTVAHYEFQTLCLRYTAGEPIEPLRGDLEKVVAAFERYAELLWQHKADRNEPAFDFVVLDDYCQLMHT